MAVESLRNRRLSHLMASIIFSEAFGMIPYGVYGGT